MTTFATFTKWLRKKQMQIEVTFAVYMFTPWEKFAFYSIVFLLFSLTFIAAVLYLPHHISLLAGRCWYYINGENIDVAASAREVVREVLTSGVLADPATLPLVTKEAAAAAAVDATVPFKAEL